MGKGKGRTGHRKTEKEKIIEQNMQWQENIHTIEHIRGHEKEMKTMWVLGENADAYGQI